MPAKPKFKSDADILDFVYSDKGLLAFIDAFNVKFGEDSEMYFFQ